MNLLLEHSRIYPSSLTSWQRAPGASQTPAYFAEAANGQKLFIKHDPAASGILLAEADGLFALARTGVIRVPRVFASNEQWLLMEAVPREPAKDIFWRRLAEQLSALHRQQGPTGWTRDNFLGRSAQHNQWSVADGSWAEFFWTRRLLPQLQRYEQRFSWTVAERQRLPLLEAYALEQLSKVSPKSTLVHGDLWSGNILCSLEQQPVLIDPAVYFGHSETDLAMTELFGGFAPAFYRRYKELLPIAEGYPERREIYNLYHKLNHANLYGSGFVWDVQKTLLELTSKVT